MLKTALVVLALALAPQELPEILVEDFEKGIDRWEFTDPAAWKQADGPTGKMLQQHRKSTYEPKVRSPFGIALLKDVYVGDFILEAKVQSTVKDYPHRDMVVVFGHQDASHMYYSHLGKKTDDHANQIFIVNGEPRKKISTKTTDGTNWTDNWHVVKVVRKVADGTIEVYWDDMKAPVQTAKDTTLAWGRIGVGTFDDMGNWDDVKLRGVKVDPPKK